MEVRIKRQPRGRSLSVFSSILFSVLLLAASSPQRAALLDQERPNIFTQSVANILPGEQVTVTISYVESLRYEAGSYVFVARLTSVQFISLVRR